MKKTLIRTIAVLAVAATLLTAIPLNASAAKNCSATYYKDNCGKVTGIKEIKMDDDTYYDCSQNTSVNIDASYLNTILNRDVSGDLFGSILSEWANIAYGIFGSNTEYTYTPYDDESFTQKCGKGTRNRDAYCDVWALLRSPASASGGTRSRKCYSSTGLTVAKSLGEVRTEMGDQIAAGINQSTCTGKDILSQGEFADALPTMNGHDKSPVLYNIVTSVDSPNGVYFYTYNSYGLAFYDFNLSILADENIDYVIETDCGGGELTLENLNTVTSQLVSQVNNTGVDSSMAITTESSSSETLTTSMSHASAMSFEQNVGMEAEFKTVTLSTSFKFGEAFTTTQGEEKSASHSSASSSTTSVVVPAYTQAVLKQDYGYGISHLSYNVPVALNFKVAVFAVSGEVYADGMCICSLSTDNYNQRYYYTTFGEQTGNAYKDLRYRHKNSTSRGVDTKTGGTKAFSGEHGFFSDDIIMPSICDLSWNSVNDTFVKTSQQGKGLNDFYKRLPMLATGAESTLTRETYKTEISEYQPLYLPKTLRVTNLADINQNVYNGATVNLSKMKVDAFNIYDVPYYGFKVADGHWEICQGSEDVFKMTEGTNTLTVTGKPGDVGCVQWVLNDNVEYTSAYESGVANSKTIKPVIIQFSVQEKYIINPNY